jgi:REP element-mobilizing transposase RayT
MPDPRKGYPALRRGRYSAENSTYFLTICAMRPCAALSQTALTDAIRRQYMAVEARGWWTVHCAVIMPDHLHLVVTLGNGARLDESVRLLKGPLCPHLRDAGVRWQPSFFDHRLRAEDNLTAVFRYVFLNPHRAGLVAAPERWPGYFCRTQDWEWFGPLIGEAEPEPEWLRD